MIRSRLSIILLVIILTLSACNLPGSGGNENEDAAGLVLTAANLTVVAEQTNAAGTQLAQGTSLVFPSPTLSNATLPSLPTNTSAPTLTSAPAKPCDLAGFVSDVTVPDGTKFDPGETFTKTWRLVNNGTCAWNSSYELVFDSGEAMGGPASQQLTSSTINPGQNVDVSVELTAPTSAGTFRGYWRLRNSNGITFGLANNAAFWVEIKVGGATGTSSPGSTNVSLTTVAQGSVRSGGTTNGNPNVGDTSGDEGSQAFIQFNISSIPDGANIDSVEVNFSNYDTLGSPFSALGCLRGYPGVFFPLGAGDYQSTTGAILRWCSTGELNTVWNDDDVRVALENALGDGVFEIRLQFNEKETNNDGNADMVRFGTVTLKVTYTNP